MFYQLQEGLLEFKSWQIKNDEIERLDKFPAKYGFPFAEDDSQQPPIVNVPFNDNLLHDYCMMLNKDNNRDINIFAI